MISLPSSTSPLKTTSRLPPGPVIVFIVLYVCLIGFLVASAPSLPERVASHFNGHGRANGWMSRSGYLFFIGILPLALGAILMAAGWLTKSLPAELINVPRRDFWLAPGRRALLSAFLMRWVGWLACLITGFIGGLHGMTVAANRVQPPQLDARSLMGFTLSFVVLLLIWVVAFLLRLANPKAQSGDRV